MMRTTTSLAAVLTAALCLSACGDASTGPEGGLTKDEAGALASAILDLDVNAGLTGAGSAAVRAGAPAAAPSTFSYHTSGEGPCPLGGTMFADVGLSGTFDDATQQGKLDLTTSSKYHGCVVKTEETGQQFTLDGAPSIDAVLHLETKPNDTFQLSGSYQGAVAWQSEGRSGTCHFDLTFSGTVNQETGAGSAKLTGTACGVSISYDAATS